MNFPCCQAYHANNLTVYPCNCQADILSIYLKENSCEFTWWFHIPDFGPDRCQFLSRDHCFMSLYRLGSEIGMFAKVREKIQHF